MSKSSMAMILLLLGGAQRVDVVLRAEQAHLLGADPQEAHVVARLLALLAQVLGQLEVHRRARAVVVDARARGDGVVVGADRDGAVRVAERRVGDHVLGVRVSLIVCVRTCQVTAVPPRRRVTVSAPSL